MKSAFKIVLMLVLAFTMTVLAFAAEGSLITYKWVDMSEYNEDGDLAYDMTLNIQAVGTEQLRQYRTDITFNNELLIPVSCGDYTTPVSLVDGASVDDLEPIWTPEVVVGSGKNKKTYTYDVPDYSWTTNGNKTTMKLTVSTTGFDYFDYSDLDFVTVAFKLASGKTLDDITASDITIDFIQFFAGQDENGNGIEYGLNEPRMPEPVNYVNELAPEAPVVLPITISVVAGDKVYLQDGSVVNIDADNDAYEVPATLGYVAVNSGIVTNNGFIAQKTYYIDGTNAIPVHDNAIYGTGDIDLRAKADDADRNGLRFRVLHSLPTRSTEDYEVTEIGFIMAAETERFITKFGSEYDLTLDKTGVIDGVTYAKIGLAYGDENGNLVNKVFDRYGRLTGDENIWDIRAVMFNIPEAFYQTTIAARPYYKIGEAVVYGEVSKMTLYDAAKAIKADAAAWEGCNDDQKAYIDEVIAAVEGPDILVEDEIIINIGSLYE